MGKGGKETIYSKKIIGHIFNQIDLGNNRKLILESRPFDFNYIDEVAKKVGEVWKEKGKGEGGQKGKTSDGEVLTLNYDKPWDPTKATFVEEYRNSLFPEKPEIVEGKATLIDKFDAENIEKALEGLKTEILLINGDFFGIQNFIFNEVSTKRAAKVLRARSAMVQLYTLIVTHYLEKEIGAKKLLFGAGKFLMVANWEEKNLQKIEIFQKALNDYFFQNYFGVSGILITTIKTERELLERRGKVEESGNIEKNNSKEVAERVKNMLDQLAEENELKKYTDKLGLLQRSSPVVQIFKEAKPDSAICNYCGRRVGRKREKEEGQVCDSCYLEIELGTVLTKYDYMTILSREELKREKESWEKLKLLKLLTLQIGDKKISYYGLFLNEFDKKNNWGIVKREQWYYISNSPDWTMELLPLKAYVPTENQKILTFQKIEGSGSGLIALKADVDRLGKTFRQFYYQSFKKFNRLSRELNFFFASYIPYFLQTNPKYQNKIYVIFAGGDDLFLVGHYEAVVEFVKEMRKKFHNWTLQKVTLSAGLVMFKSSTPIKYISEMVDEAEKRAKRVGEEEGTDRNGIDLFGISMKFDTFIQIEERWKEIYQKVEKNITSTLLYRLVELSQMAKDAEKNPLKTIWLSRLHYLINRNFSGSQENRECFLKEMRNLIYQYREKLIPSIYLTIYKRRDNGN